MNIQKAQEGFTRLAAGLIVLAALVYTYDGTMTFCQAHGAVGWRGALIAAMNDLTVLVGVLWPERSLQLLAGLCASFTVWGNLSHAEKSVAGFAIAGIAPALAILMVAALEWIGQHGPVEPEVTEPVEQPSTEPVEPEVEVTVTVQPEPIRPKPVRPAPPRRAITPGQRVRPTDHPLWVEWAGATPPWQPADMVLAEKQVLSKELSMDAAGARIRRWTKIKADLLSSS